VRLSRRTRRAKTNTNAPPASRSTDGCEFAWRVHSAQEVWTGKVDIKASILLALEGGALFAVLSGHGEGGILNDLPGWAHNVEITGIVLLVVAAIFAIAGVSPLLGSAREHQRQYNQHFIYFGHLRHWSDAELRSRLAGLTADEELEMLSRQLVEMSKRNWAKHRYVQISLGATALGVLAIAIAALASG
jgi:hypothetical protein